MRSLYLLVSVALLLAGVAVQTFLGAVISFLMLFAGDSLERAVYWLMGHLHTSTWPKVWSVLLVALPAYVLVRIHARDLNALLLGEADAYTLGVDVERIRPAMDVWALAERFFAPEEIVVLRDLPAAEQRHVVTQIGSPGHIPCIYR